MFRRAGHAIRIELERIKHEIELYRRNEEQSKRVLERRIRKADGEMSPKWS